MFACLTYEDKIECKWCGPEKQDANLGRKGRKCVKSERPGAAARKINVEEKIWVSLATRALATRHHLFSSIGELYPQNVQFVVSTSFFWCKEICCAMNNFVKEMFWRNVFWKSFFWPLSLHVVTIVSPNWSICLLTTSTHWRVSVISWELGAFYLLKCKLVLVHR